MAWSPHGHPLPGTSPVQASGRRRARGSPGTEQEQSSGPALPFICLVWPAASSGSPNSRQADVRGPPVPLGSCYLLSPCSQAGLWARLSRQSSWSPAKASVGPGMLPGGARPQEKPQACGPVLGCLLQQGLLVSTAAPRSHQPGRQARGLLEASCRGPEPHSRPCAVPPPHPASSPPPGSGGERERENANLRL